MIADPSTWEMRESIDGASLKRRFGGHGGISTEWELEADYRHLAEIVPLLPTIPLIQMGVSKFCAWIILPEGVPWDLAGKVTAAWAMGHPDDTSVNRLTRLLVRCYVWGEAYRRHLPVRTAWADAKFQEWIAAGMP